MWFWLALIGVGVGMLIGLAPLMASGGGGFSGAGDLSPTKRKD